MKYELGDKVRIKACYKRQKIAEQMEQDGIEQDIDDYLFSEAMEGVSYNFIKYKREETNEEGYICGTRTIKIEADLMAQHEGEVYWADDRIYQEDYKMKKFYIVATRMNIIRYVDFDDIQYIYGDEVAQ